MVYGYVRVVFHGVDRLIYTSVVVGSVYAVLLSWPYLDVEIPGHREQLDVPCLGVDLHEHNGVRAAPHLLVVWPRVHAKHKHVERTFREFLVPEHLLDPVARGSVDLPRLR